MEPYDLSLGVSQGLMVEDDDEEEVESLRQSSTGEGAARPKWTQTLKAALNEAATAVNKVTSSVSEAMSRTAASASELLGDRELRRWVPDCLLPLAQVDG